MKMQLVHLDFKEILCSIIIEGGEDVLESMQVIQLTKGGEFSLCPIYKKRNNKGFRVFAIANKNGLPVFFDRFDKQGCAEHALSWVKHVWHSYLQRLGPIQSEYFKKACKKKQLEFLRTYDWRCTSYFQKLREYIPRISF